MSWNRQPQQQFQHYGNKYRQPQAPHYAAPQQPQPQRPAALKRQASDLKSIYPLTKWCACYNTHQQSNASNSNDYNPDDLDVTSKIESTNIYVPMDLEETIINQVQEYIDEEKELKQRLSQQKDDIAASKNKADEEKEGKIDTFMTFTSITDRSRARELLDQNGWDLQKAAAQQFSSSPAVNVQNSGEGGYNRANSAQKAVIRMILPDNRQYTYQMDGNDTFWGVYGRLLQSVPELASRAFTLEISATGHELKENEFDQTLSDAKLVPRGDIKIKY